RALTRRIDPGADSSDESLWRFLGARLRIEDGRLTSDLNPGQLARIASYVSPGLPGAVSPDLLEAAWTSSLRDQIVSDIDVNATVDWRRMRRQIDVLGVSALLETADLPLTDTRAQIVIEDGEVRIPTLSLTLGASSASLNGFAGGFDRSDVPWFDRPASVTIESAELDLDELGRLFPGIRSDAVVRLEARIDGPASGLTIPWLRLQSGASSASVSGTVVGLPESADVELTLSDAVAAPSELRRVFPSQRWIRRFTAGEVDLSGYVRGRMGSGDDRDLMTLSGNDLDLSFTAQAASAAGNLRAAIEASGPVSDSLAFSASGDLDGVRLRGWLGPGVASGFLTGSFSAEGRGISKIGSSGRIEGRLVSPRIASSTADSAFADVSWRNATADGVVTLFQDGGRLQMEGAADLLGSSPVASIEVDLVRMNVGPLLGIDSLFTRFDARAALTSNYRWNDRFSAGLTVRFDSSTVAVGDSTGVIVPQRINLNIRPVSSQRPEVEITSDIADLTVQSDASLRTMVAGIQAWTGGIRRVVRRQSRKFLYPEIAETETDLSDLEQLLAVENARVRFSGRAPATIALSTQLKQPALLQPFWPTSPTVGGRSAVELTAGLSADTLHARLSSSSDSLIVSGTNAGDIRLLDSDLIITMALGRVPTLLEASRLDVTVRSGSLLAAGQSMSNTAVTTSLDGRNGRLVVGSSGGAGVDSIRVSADLQLARASNTARFDRFDIDTATGRWQLETPATFDFYADATSIDAFRLVHYKEGTESGQILRAAGTLSSDTSDSLRIGADNVFLLEISDFFAIRPALGGMLNTDLTLTGGRENPQVSGQLSVERASLDHRVLGDVRLESEFVAGSPDVAVNLVLSPAVVPEGSTIVGSDTPAVGIENALRIGGSVRLPSFTGSYPGRLNLDADVGRADLFFFKYIFEETLGQVEGFTAGSGTITGSFFQPVFDVQMRVSDGRFEIPIIGETYSIEGGVRIDEIGIHLQDSLLSDPSGGEATVAGVIEFNRYRFFTLDLSGSVDELRIMNIASSDELPFYGYLWVSGSFELTGPTFNATLTSSDAVTRSDSDLFIPIVEETAEADESFIVFEDTPGVIPDFEALAARPFLLSRRPEAERQFLEGLNLDLSIFAPPGSTIHLVIDPLLGDVINAESTGSVQLQRVDGEFRTFGELRVRGGDYLFTAGEVFVRRFLIQEGGTIIWDGDPINARLDIPAVYRTRASLAGLPGSEGRETSFVPVVVNLQISGTVYSPQVDLSLAIDRSNQNVLGDYQGLEAQLNQPDRATEYATSVLLTNSFRLTTESIGTDSGSQIAFTSLSQLVSSQLNRFLSEALPNVDFSLGVIGDNAQNLDLTYGVALRLLDERLIIRGEGVYQAANTTDRVTTDEGLQGEFVVEIRLNPNVSVEVFYRRESDILEAAELTNTAGAGVSFQTEFTSWRQLVRRVIRSSDD
ncbi:MAG: hypothetical protein HKN17_04050, partial [Rhodothermales bacterium]|nr:hypothetical protein [Rhodothermales bacterium]